MLAFAVLLFMLINNRVLPPQSFNEICVDILSRDFGMKEFSDFE